MEVVPDTSFYIDVQRMQANALAWIEAHPNVNFVLTPIVYGELRVGQPDTSIIERLVGSGPRLTLDYECALRFGEVARSLRSEGRMIGANDLWIASIALVHAFPVLTRNIGEFSRVPGLTVEGY